MTTNNSIFNDLFNIQGIALEKEADLSKFNLRLDKILNSYIKALTQLNKQVTFSVRFPDTTENLEALKVAEWKNNSLKLLYRSTKNRDLEPIKSPDAISKLDLIALLPGLTLRICKLYSNQITDYDKKIKESAELLDKTIEALPDGFKSWVNDILKDI